MVVEFVVREFKFLFIAIQPVRKLVIKLGVDFQQQLKLVFQLSVQPQPVLFQLPVIQLQLFIQQIIQLLFKRLRVLEPIVIQF